MVLLDAPDNFGALFVVAALLVGGIGSVCSVRSVWFRLFPRKDHGSGKDGPPGSLMRSVQAAYTTYLRAGEYGESELFPYAWSPFIEPLNAWTSLTYSLFGFVILFTGLQDYIALSAADGGVAAVNITAANPGFSILYGVSTVYLGVASFLFHASHSETWRKADAGMTSGCIITPLVLAVYDRARPPLLGPSTMVFLAALLQTSLTHGYLPYGSSDLLLPTLVGTNWILELAPRYGGAVDPGQYTLWWRCFFTVIGGMLLRLSDIKRANGGFFTWAMRGYWAILLFPFGYQLGLTDPAILCGVAAGIVVTMQPSRGHIFWHFGSAYSLYVWWYQYRVRPGDPPVFRSNDATLIAVVFCVAVKNAVRRLVMMVPWGTQELRNRIMFFAEHCFFALWCYNAVLVEPEALAAGSSWLVNVRECWRNVADSESFRFFYMAKVGTAVEDVLFILLAHRSAVNMAATPPTTTIAGATDSTSPGSGPATAAAAAAGASVSGDDSGGERANRERDIKMLVHHGATAALCLLSVFSGYTRVGSLVMLLHDVRWVSLAGIPL